MVSLIYAMVSFIYAMVSLNLFNVTLGMVLWALAEVYSPEVCNSLHSCFEMCYRIVMNAPT